MERLERELRAEIAAVHRSYKREIVLIRHPSIRFGGADVDFNKLTLKSGEAVAAAQDIARRAGNPELVADHLLIALLDQELPRTLAARAGTDATALRAEAEARLRSQPTISGGNAQPQASPAFRRVLDGAFEEMWALGDDFVSVEHLLLALDVLPRDALLAVLQDVRGGQRVTSQDPEGSYQALEKYGRDLTALAEAGKLDPVIGRDEEIPRSSRCSAADEEQPRARRRVRRREDRDRRGARAGLVAGDVPEGLDAPGRSTTSRSSRVRDVPR